MKAQTDRCVTINADILRVTPRAVQIRCTDGVPRWIPKSCIWEPHEKKLDEMAGQMLPMRIFEWVAKKDKIPLAR